MTADTKPRYVMGALIALVGLIVAWALLRFVPDVLVSSVSGAISGGFGVVAVSRIWPGLPVRKMHLWLGSVVLYGIAVALVRLV